MILDTSSLAHTKYNCKYHIVFAPKYRRQIIYGKIKKDIGVMIYPKFLVPTVFLVLRLAGENSFLLTFGLYLARNSCFVRNYHIKIK